MSTTLVEPKCFFNINEFCYCSKYCHSFIEVTVIDEFKHSILMKFMQSLEISVRSSKYEKDFFSKCDQIHRNLRIWLHLLKKSLMENFIFCAVTLWSARCYKAMIKKLSFEKILFKISTTPFKQKASINLNSYRRNFRSL